MLILPFEEILRGNLCQFLPEDSGGRHFQSAFALRRFDAVPVEYISVVRWIYQVYDVPLCNQLLCGQHPRRGSLGEILLLQTEVDLEEIKKIFQNTLTGTIRVGGKLYDSTKGEIVTDDVEISINSDYQIEELVLAGQVVSGTHPIQSVNGYVVGTTIEAASGSTTAAADLPLSGTVPIKSVEGVMIGSSVEADRIVSKEWMLWAVTKAEKELGSGTGKLKLRYVYDMFVTKFPWLEGVISFEMVSMMVDDALEEMREMLETNKAVQEFVNGPTEETGKEQ